MSSWYWTNRLRHPLKKLPYSAPIPVSPPNSGGEQTSVTSAAPSAPDVLLIPGRAGSMPLVDGDASNKLGAVNDQHAIDLWLREFSDGTRREYTRHAKRLLAWLASVQLTLDTCTREHLTRYFDQLDEPELLHQHVDLFVPLEHQANFKRLFAMDERTTIQRAARSRKIIVAMYRWLQLNGYVTTISIPKLPGTTYDQRGNAIDEAREELAKRVLADHQWKIVDEAIERLNWLKEPQARCRAIAVWLRESGARREELASARLDAMQRHKGELGKPPVWLWRIRGKGGKVRYVAVTPAMINALKRYRLSQGIPFFDEDPFLAPANSAANTDARDMFVFYARQTVVRTKQLAHAQSAQSMSQGLDEKSLRAVKQHKKRPGVRSISSTTIYNDIKKLAAAATATAANEYDRNRIAALAPHWFRHRRALQLIGKLSPRQVAQYLGHSSTETTKVYTFQEEVDLARAVLATNPNVLLADDTT